MYLQTSFTCDFSIFCRVADVSQRKALSLLKECAIVLVQDFIFFFLIVVITVILFANDLYWWENL